jgi:hypothetical protein
MINPGIIGATKFHPGKLPGLVLYHDYTTNRDLVPKTATSGLTLTRATEATYTDADGVLSTVASGAFAIGNRGLQIFGGATNLARDSGAMSNASARWAYANPSAQAGATINPIGVPLIKIEDADTSSASRVIRQTALAGGWTLAASTQYTVSVYAKKGEYNTFTLLALDNSLFSSAYFNLDSAIAVQSQTGLGSGCAIRHIGDGVYRCSLTFTSTATPTGSYFDMRMSNTGVAAGPSGTTYTGVVGNGMYFGGAQLETGATATPYIPTTSASATRNADVIAINDVASWWNEVGSTILVEYETPADFSSTAIAISLSDGGIFNDSIYLPIVTDAASNIAVIDGGAAQSGATFPGLVHTARQIVRRAAVVKPNDFRQAFNGSTSFPVDTSGTVPTDIDQAWLGSNWSGAGNQLRGYIRQLAIFNRALTNAELQLISQR